MSTVKYVSQYPLRCATEGASGYDLRAVMTDRKSLVIAPGGRAKISTGVHLAMPAGMEAQIRPRSGLAMRWGLVAVLGTIDSDFRGAIAVVLINHDEGPLTVSAGDRIAQLVFAPVIHPEFIEMAKPDDLPETVRGEGGFGSTGMRALPGEPSDEHGHPLPTPGPLLQQRIDEPKVPCTKGPNMFRAAMAAEVENYRAVVAKEMAAADAHSLRVFNSDGVYGSVSAAGELTGLAPFIPTLDPGLADTVFTTPEAGVQWSGNVFGAGNHARQEAAERQLLDAAKGAGFEPSLIAPASIGDVTDALTSLRADLRDLADEIAHPSLPPKLNDQAALADRLRALAGGR